MISNILYMILGAAIYALMNKIMASIGKVLYRRKVERTVDYMKQYMKDNPEEDFKKLKEQLAIIEKALEEDVF